MMQGKIIGAGSYLPKNVVTNADLAKRVETSDEWIQKRTGIKQRHHAAADEFTSDLATHAAKDALKNAGLGAADIDMIVVATTTPDHSFPSVATQVQANLNIQHGFAFDVQAVCSGFVYALSTANNFIKAGQVKNALVIGAETFTRLLDWEDRSTCVLFGDGAGAVVLSATDKEGEGILSTHLFSDGTYKNLLHADGGVSLTQSAGVTKMEGREVFRHAVQKLAQAVDVALEANAVAASDLDWLVPHQANLRIIEATANKLDMPLDKVVVTVDRHANTSAASIPLAFAEAWQDSRLKPGQLVLLEAMGAGFTWGSALVRL